MPWCARARVCECVCGGGAQVEQGQRHATRPGHVKGQSGRTRAVGVRPTARFSGRPNSRPHFQATLPGPLCAAWPPLPPQPADLGLSVRVHLGVHRRALLEYAPVQVLVLAPLEHDAPAAGRDAAVVHDAAEVEGDRDARRAAVACKVVKPGSAGRVDGVRGWVREAEVVCVCGGGGGVGALGVASMGGLHWQGGRWPLEVRTPAIPCRQHARRWIALALASLPPTQPSTTPTAQHSRLPPSPAHLSQSMPFVLLATTSNSQRFSGSDGSSELLP